MGEHALHRDADLAGVVETALGERRHSVIEVGVRRDDCRRRAAVLERAAGTRRELRAQAPADPGAADEAEEADPRVGGELARQVIAVESERLAPGLRQACLVQHRYETEAGEWRRKCRLDDDRASRGDRRRDLVHDQVQRVVESAERDDDADRLALRKGDAAGRGGVDVHRDDVAAFATQELAAVAHPVDGARHLDTRVDERLSPFPGGEDRQTLGLPFHAAGHPAQDLDPAQRRQPSPAIPEEAVRNLESAVDRLTARERDRADWRPIEGGPHRELHHADRPAHSTAASWRSFSSSTSTRTFSE